MRTSTRKRLSMWPKLVLIAALAGGGRAYADEPTPPIPPPPGAQPTSPPKADPVRPDEPVYRAPRVAAVGARDPEHPVVRAEAGNYGLFFQFGGLATMTANNERIRAATAISRVGFKIVLNERWQIPIFAGTGLNIASRSNQDAATSWGFDIGAGFEYHFRIWRRISPFIGATLGFGIDDPSGPSNWQFGLAFGPQLGIEYFLADRLSLTALYQFVFLFAFEDQLFRFGFATQAGGLLVLTAYF